MKHLLGILVLDRPKTFEKCITQLLSQDGREDLHIVVVNNGSNQETTEVIERYRKDVDEVITHAWNVGYCFGVNTWMARRKPGQHCIQVDQDCIMYSKDWLEMIMRVLQDKDMGFLAPRRPTAWIDRPDKVEGYRAIKPEKRHNLWLEVPSHGALIAPMLVYKGEMLDKMGFENEATGWGDLESYYRVRALGYKSAYIPDIFVYQWGRDFDEQCNHPQRGAHLQLLGMRAELNRKYIANYLMGKGVYCGTRWLPETITDPEYRKYSDENFEFHKNYGRPDVAV